MNVNLNVGKVFQGIMAYWDKVEEAASYTLTLYALDKNKKVECEIAIVVLDRNTRYYTFQGLSCNYGYCLKVEAEDRNGEIIARSDRKECDPSNVVEITTKGIHVYL